MSPFRVCFLGTPEFAVPTLSALEKSEQFKVVGVISQPDRPAGRKLELQASPVKKKAIEFNLPVITPEKINTEEIRNQISDMKPDLGIVVAFGQILGQKVLDLFPRGSFNIHASLLPRWRGAAPIQRSLEAGDTETGVCLQKIVKELDAGDVLGSRKILITPEMDALKLHDTLSVLGTELIENELIKYLKKELTPEPQDPKFVTYAKKLDKSESHIIWDMPAKNILNKIKAFTLGPGTYTLFQGKKVKLHKLSVSEIAYKNSKPGQIIDITNNSTILVACQTGALEILELQPESRNRMKSADFIKGYGIKKGDLLG